MRRVALLACVFVPAPLLADASGIEPLVTVDKIEAAAAKCGAKFSISHAPDFDEETGAINENGTLVVGVERSNSPEAIACMKAHIPNIITALVGRSKGGVALGQTQLDDILKRCKWRKKDGHISLQSGGELRFEPTMKAKYERVDCVLKGVWPYGPTIGFIGNEQNGAEEQR